MRGSRGSQDHELCWTYIAGAGSLASSLVFGCDREFRPGRIGQPLTSGQHIGVMGIGCLVFTSAEASGVFGLIAYAIQSFGMALVIGFLFTQAFVSPGLMPRRGCGARRTHGSCCRYRACNCNRGGYVYLAWPLCADDIRNGRHCC